MFCFKKKKIKKKNPHKKRDLKGSSGDPMEKCCCHWMDWEVYLQKCYCSSLLGRFKEVLRVGIETAATLVSAKRYQFIETVPKVV